MCRRAGCRTRFRGYWVAGGEQERDVECVPDMAMCPKVIRIPFVCGESRDCSTTQRAGEKGADPLLSSEKHHAQLRQNCQSCAFLLQSRSTRFNALYGVAVGVGVAVGAQFGRPNKCKSLSDTSRSPLGMHPLN